MGDNTAHEQYTHAYKRYMYAQQQHSLQPQPLWPEEGQYQYGYTNPNTNNNAVYPLSQSQVDEYNHARSLPRYPNTARHIDDPNYISEPQPILPPYDFYRTSEWAGSRYTQEQLRASLPMDNQDDVIRYYSQFPSHEPTPPQMERLSLDPTYRHQPPPVDRRIPYGIPIYNYEGLEIQQQPKQLQEPQQQQQQQIQQLQHPAFVVSYEEQQLQQPAYVDSNEGQQERSYNNSHIYMNTQEIHKPLFRKPRSQPEQQYARDPSEQENRRWSVQEQQQHTSEAQVQLFQPALAQNMPNAHTQTARESNTRGVEKKIAEIHAEAAEELGVAAAASHASISSALAKTSIKAILSSKANKPTEVSKQVVGRKVEQSSANFDNQTAKNEFSSKANNATNPGNNAVQRIVPSSASVDHQKAKNVRVLGKSLASAAQQSMAHVDQEPPVAVLRTIGSERSSGANTNAQIYVNTNAYKATTVQYDFRSPEMPDAKLGNELLSDLVELDNFKNSDAKEKYVIGDKLLSDIDKMIESGCDKLLPSSANLELEKTGASNSGNLKTLNSRPSDKTSERISRFSPISVDGKDATNDAKTMQISSGHKDVLPDKPAIHSSTNEVTVPAISDAVGVSSVTTAPFSEGGAVDEPCSTDASSLIQKHIGFVTNRQSPPALQSAIPQRASDTSHVEADVPQKPTMLAQPTRFMHSPPANTQPAVAQDMSTQAFGDTSLDDELPAGMRITPRRRVDSTSSDSLGDSTVSSKSVQESAGPNVNAKAQPQNVPTRKQRNAKTKVGTYSPPRGQPSKKTGKASGSTTVERKGGPVRLGRGAKETTKSPSEPCKSTKNPSIAGSGVSKIRRLRQLPRPNLRGLQREQEAKENQGLQDNQPRSMLGVSTHTTTSTDMYGKRESHSASGTGRIVVDITHSDSEDIMSDAPSPTASLTDSTHAPPLSSPASRPNARDPPNGRGGLSSSNMPAYRMRSFSSRAGSTSPPPALLRVSYTSPPALLPLTTSRDSNRDSRSAENRHDLSLQKRLVEDGQVVPPFEEQPNRGITTRFLTDYMNVHRSLKTLQERLFVLFNVLLQMIKSHSEEICETNIRNRYLTIPHMPYSRETLSKFDMPRGRTPEGERVVMINDFFTCALALALVDELWQGLSGLGQKGWLLSQLRAINVSRSVEGALKGLLVNVESNDLWAYEPTPTHLSRAARRANTNVNANADGSDNLNIDANVDTIVAQGGDLARAGASSAVSEVQGIDNEYAMGSGEMYGADKDLISDGMNDSDSQSTPDNTEYTRNRARLGVRATKLDDDSCNDTSTSSLSSNSTAVLSGHNGRSRESTSSSLPPRRKILRRKSSHRVRSATGRNSVPKSERGGVQRTRASAQTYAAVVASGGSVSSVPNRRSARTRARTNTRTNARTDSSLNTLAPISTKENEKVAPVNREVVQSTPHTKGGLMGFEVTLSQTRKNQRYGRTLSEENPLHMPLSVPVEYSMIVNQSNVVVRGDGEVSSDLFKPDKTQAPPLAIEERSQKEVSQARRRTNMEKEQKKAEAKMAKEKAMEEERERYRLQRQQKLQQKAAAERKKKQRVLEENKTKSREKIQKRRQKGLNSSVVKEEQRCKRKASHRRVHTPEGHTRKRARMKNSYTHTQQETTGAESSGSSEDSEDDDVSIVARVSGMKTTSPMDTGSVRSSNSTDTGSDSGSDTDNDSENDLASSITDDESVRGTDSINAIGGKGATSSSFDRMGTLNGGHDEAVVVVTGRGKGNMEMRRFVKLEGNEKVISAHRLESIAWHLRIRFGPNLRLLQNKHYMSDCALLRRESAQLKRLCLRAKGVKSYGAVPHERLQQTSYSMSASTTTGLDVTANVNKATPNSTGTAVGSNISTNSGMNATASEAPSVGAAGSADPGVVVDIIHMEEESDECDWESQDTEWDGYLSDDELLEDAWIVRRDLRVAEANLAGYRERIEDGGDTTDDEDMNEESELLHQVNILTESLNSQNGLLRNRYRLFAHAHHGDLSPIRRRDSIEESISQRDTGPSLYLSPGHTDIYEAANIQLHLNAESSQTTRGVQGESENHTRTPTPALFKTSRSMLATASPFSTETVRAGKKSAGVERDPAGNAATIANNVEGITGVVGTAGMNVTTTIDELVEARERLDVMKERLNKHQIFVCGIY
ncbi:hypothetical protein SARC_10764, partial [Sphaeroforma arctica JP610]